MVAGGRLLAHIAQAMRKQITSGIVLCVLCGCGVLLLGCQGEVSLPAAGAESAGEVEDPVARAQALIESGNQAYSAGDFELAARRFGAAAVVKEDDPAAYFGLGMSLTKLGRDEDARLAYRRARHLVQEQRKQEAEAAEEETP